MLSTNYSNITKDILQELLPRKSMLT